MAGQFDRITTPGEAGKIPIKISTKKAAGTLSKSITVNTNITGADSTIRLTIKGEIWQPVQVTPASAAFGRLTADQAATETTRRLTIVNNIEGELKLTNVVSNSPSFKAEIQPVEAGKKFELVVSMVPPLQPGNNTGKITVDTGLDEPKTLEIPVYAFVTAPIDVTPSQLMVQSRRSADMKRQLYIRSNDGKEFEISELKCTSEKLKLTISDMRGNKQTYQLAIDIPGDYQPPPQGDTISFKTTHPAAPTMTIPVTTQPMPAGPAGVKTVTPARPAAGSFTGRNMNGAVKPKPAGASGEGKPSETPDANKPGAKDNASATTPPAKGNEPKPQGA